MKKMKFICASLLITASGMAIAAPQEAADREASEYINRTSMSKKQIIDALVDDKFDKRVAELAVAKAEREWGGPAIWNDKATESAETQMSSKKLSCPELLSELVQRQKFTTAQANHAAKTTKVCQ